MRWRDTMRSIFSKKYEIELDEDLTVLRVREDTIIHLNESLIVLAHIVSDEASQFNLLKRQLLRVSLELSDQSRALEFCRDGVATKHDEYTQALVYLHDLEERRNGIREDIAATKTLIEEALSELKEVFRSNQVDTSDATSEIQLRQFEIRKLERQIQENKQVAEQSTTIQHENEAKLEEEKELTAR
jgi:chromosome segregation ATPase